MKTQSIYANVGYDSKTTYDLSTDVMPETATVMPEGGYYDSNPPAFVDPRPLVTNIQNITPMAAVAVTPSTPVSVSTMPGATATMTLKTTIVDKSGVIPANVTVNGKSYANTESGYIQLTGININALVTITSVGYKDYSALAKDIPAKIVMQEETNTLDNVFVKPKSKSKFGLWLLLGIGVVTIAASSSGNKKGVKKESLGMPKHKPQHPKTPKSIKAKI